MITEILKLARANKEGFTVWVTDLTPVRNGIAVAYAETQNSHDREGLKKCIEHAKANGNVIGGWYDTESKKYYFDSIRLFKDNVAIFDLTHLREIRL